MQSKTNNYVSGAWKWLITILLNGCEVSVNCLINIWFLCTDYYTHLLSMKGKFFISPVDGDCCNFIASHALENKWLLSRHSGLILKQRWNKIARLVQSSVSAHPRLSVHDGRVDGKRARASVGTNVLCSYFLQTEIFPVVERKRLIEWWNLQSLEWLECYLICKVSLSDDRKTVINGYGNGKSPGEFLRRGWDMRILGM